MKKILLFGCGGQVGGALRARLSHDYELLAVDVEQVNLTKPDQIQQIIKQETPDLIINAAAYTAVDQAEQDKEVCFAVNAQAPKVMAEQAHRQGAAMIHYSTDYVYDGTKGSPYTEDDATNPLGVYGESKLQGDQAVLNSGAGALIFRTSWVYGATGKNFYLTMCKLLQERDELSVVNDQFGTPTLATAIADASTEIINQSANDMPGFFKQNRGLYNMTCGGETSWYGFTAEIASTLQAPGVKLAEFKPIPTNAYPTPAKRPENTVLSNQKLLDTFSVALPEWKQALKSISAN